LISIASQCLMTTTNDMPHRHASRGTELLSLIVDEFARELQNGASPQIERFLPRVASDESVELLLRLIDAEICALRRRGIECDFADYASRFPTFRAVLVETATSAILRRDGSEGDSQGHASGIRLVEHFRLDHIIGQGSFGV